LFYSEKRGQGSNLGKKAPKILKTPRPENGEKKNSIYLARGEEKEGGPSNPEDRKLTEDLPIFMVDMRGNGYRKGMVAR